MNKKFEGAKWIINPGCKNNDGSTLFRKEIVIKKPIKTAVMYGVGLGYGIFSLNGKLVTDDVLTTPFTKFDSRVLYLTYDIKDLLKEGSNAVGAFVGNGWYNDVGKTWNFDTASWRGNKKLLMQIEVTYDDETTDCFVTDNTWKAAEGPCVYNHIREGEIYDARMEQAGWDEINFNDNHWNNARVWQGAGGEVGAGRIAPYQKNQSTVSSYI